MRRAVIALLALLGIGGVLVWLGYWAAGEMLGNPRFDAQAFADRWHGPDAQPPFGPRG